MSEHRTLQDQKHSPIQLLREAGDTLNRIRRTLSMAVDRTPPALSRISATISVASVAEVPVHLQDYEDFAPLWARLVPADIEGRAALIYLLARRNEFIPRMYPAICANFGFEDLALRSTVRALFGAEPWEEHGLMHRANQRATGLSEPIIEALAACSETLFIRHGERLFRQGDAGDAVYVVINGRLRAAHENPDGTQSPVGEIGRGEIIGEQAIITGEPRGASVYALRDSVLVRVSAEAFHVLIEQEATVLLNVTRTVIARTQRQLAGQTGRNTVSTIALLGAASGAPLNEFARRLAATLDEFESTRVLSSTIVDDTLGAGMAQCDADCPNSERLGTWLNEQELAYACVVYITDQGLTEWTRRCLRQADRIVVVGVAGASPKPGPVQEMLKQPGPGYADLELALIHPNGSVTPGSTAPWLNERQIRRVHHIMPGDPASYRRMARVLTGRGIGLALAGGGARGYAHIGVIRALEEAGIPVDALAGASIGALVCSFVAMGKTSAELEAWAVDFAHDFNKYVDLTLPVISLIRGGRLNAMLQEQFCCYDIEDLPTPVIAMGTSLIYAQSVALTRGPLWQAVRSSISIPGVLPPVAAGDDIYVDGGILNNLPVDVLRQYLEGGTVIAVNISSSDAEFVKQYRFSPNESGIRAIISRWLPEDKRVVAPALLDQIMRITSLASSRHSTEMGKAADLFIEPPVLLHGISDFAHAPALIEEGYRATAEALERWERRNN